MNRISTVYFLIIILISISIFSSCNKNNKLNKFSPDIEKGLNNWELSFVDFELSDFRKTGTIPFENFKSGELKDTIQFYPIYKSVISFSADRNKFIDIYSYQLGLTRDSDELVSLAEVDQEISLIDITERTWNRILFFGSFSKIEEVVWIDNTTFLLAGIEAADTPKRKPIILIGNTVSKTVDSYSNINKNCYQKKEYVTDKIKNLNIEKR